MPTLVHRFARERLLATAHLEGRLMKTEHHTFARRKRVEAALEALATSVRNR